MKNYIYALLFLMIFTISILACSGDGDENNSSSDGDTSENSDNDNANADGDSSTADGDTDGSTQTGDLADKLRKLGANIDDQKPLDDLEQPLGKKHTALDVISELLVVGPEMNKSNTNIIDDGTTKYENLFKDKESSWSPEAVKYGTSGDFDGDGKDEFVIVRFSNKKFFISGYDDKATGFEAFEDVEFAWPFSNKPIDIDVASGDFDGDSKDEIAVTAGTWGTKKNELDEEVKYQSAALWVFDDLEKNFAQLTMKQFKDAKKIRVALGNIDEDWNDEMAISIQTKGNVNTFALYDWAETKIDEIKSGTVEWLNDEGKLEVGILSDVTIGDVDNDGKSEVLFGGVIRDTSFSPATGQTGMYFGFMLDDYSKSYKSSGKVIGLLTASNPPMTFIDSSINLIDLDKDKKPEVQLNHMIFHNFSDEKPWKNRSNIDERQIYQASPTHTEYSRKFDSLTVGDFTGDGKEDIAFTSFLGQKIFIWGSKQDGTLAQLKTISSANTAGYPLLVSGNIDEDSIIVEYDEDYKFVFTSPIVVAALASPPCASGIGQSTDNCATYYGDTESSSVTTENSLSFRASFIVGANVEDRIFTQSAFELEAELGLELTTTWSETITQEVSVVYSTGSIEDGIVFVTIPYDVYTYTISSHPEEGMVGTKTTVSIPRKPIILIAERDFYNQTIEDENAKIGKEVFKHTPGDLSTYPSKSDRDKLIDEYGGMESAEQSVGQGTGSTDVSITISEEFSEGFSLAIDFDLTVKTTVGGVTMGLSVGMGYENSLMMTSGNSTTFGGSIGSIDETNFADKQFRYGLFTYPIMHKSGMNFHVINYYVSK